jgi:hypothetical protein
MRLHLIVLAVRLLCSGFFMSKYNTQIGSVWGNLTVIGEERIRRDTPKSKKKHSYCRNLILRCICGNQIKAYCSNVVRGDYVSCGCMRGSFSKERATIHGMTKSREYNIWIGMKARCLDIKATSFKRYGALGIKVCHRWLESFQNFLDDMGLCPSVNHSLDRYPNNKGDYTPNNCRWATPKEQARNTKNNVYIIYNGRRRLLVEWAEELGIKSQTIYVRIFVRKWDIERALTTMP